MTRGKQFHWEAGQQYNNTMASRGSMIAIRNQYRGTGGHQENSLGSNEAAPRPTARQHLVSKVIQGAPFKSANSRAVSLSYLYPQVQTYTATLVRSRPYPNNDKLQYKVGSVAPADKPSASGNRDMARAKQYQGMGRWYSDVVVPKHDTAAPEGGERWGPRWWQLQHCGRESGLGSDGPWKIVDTRTPRSLMRGDDRRHHTSPFPTSPILDADSLCRSSPTMQPALDRYAQVRPSLPKSSKQERTSATSSCTGHPGGQRPQVPVAGVDLEDDVAPCEIPNAKPTNPRSSFWPNGG
ncbi:hypothetical protein BD779DRAFT_1472377 [Infundibulicybe gibba]|nr:hypothetical protein BD779DRAFT_1472377 [Infundibulicybe gibba]